MMKPGIWMLRLLLWLPVLGMAAYGIYFLYMVSELAPNAHHPDGYYEHITHRIELPLTTEAKTLDTALEAYIQKHPKYKVSSDTTSRMNCDCFDLRKEIRFIAGPREIYTLTSEMLDSFLIIDVVTHDSLSLLSQTKTSKMDGFEKRRIINRLRLEILDSLPGPSYLK